MTAVAFDTLKLARKLRDTAGMSQVQAEGVADALAEAMSGAELATKGDVAAAKSELKADLAELKTEISRCATKADLAELKAEISRCATKADFAELKAEISSTKLDLADVRTSIADAKSDTLKTVMAMIIGAVVANTVMVLGAMFGLAKLLGH